jgi:hypothetical protein
MKTRVDYFRVVVWTIAFAMSIGVWAMIISVTKPLILP